MEVDGNRRCVPKCTSSLSASVVVAKLKCIMCSVNQRNGVAGDSRWADMARMHAIASQRRGGEPFRSGIDMGGLLGSAHYCWRPSRKSGGLADRYDDLLHSGHETRSSVDSDMEGDLKRQSIRRKISSLPHVLGVAPAYRASFHCIEVHLLPESVRPLTDVTVHRP